MSEEKQLVVPDLSALEAALGTVVEVDISANAYGQVPPPPETVKYRQGDAIEEATWFYSFKLAPEQYADDKRRDSAVTHVAGWQSKWPDFDNSVNFSYAATYADNVKTLTMDGNGKPVVSGFTQDVAVKLVLPGDRYNGNKDTKYISSVVNPTMKTSAMDTWIQVMLRFLPDAQRAMYTPKYNATLSALAKLRLFRELLKLDITILAPITWTFEADYNEAKGFDRVPAVRGMKKFAKTNGKGETIYEPLREYTYTTLRRNKKPVEPTTLSGRTSIELNEEGFGEILDVNGLELIKNVQAFQAGKNPREGVK